MMGKKFKSSKIKKFIKQALCVVLAVALIEGDIPLFNNLTARQLIHAPKKVKAESYVKYNVGNYTKMTAGTTHYRIDSWDDFVWYSQAYYEASQGSYGAGVTHANDTVELVIQSNEQNSSIELTNRFEPIGNDDSVFAGKLLFDVNSQDMFNIDAPFFGTVSETAKIAFISDENSPKTITITRTANKPGDPLLAYKVVSDGDPNTHADWRFLFEAFANDRDVTYGGVIGLIDDGANVELTVANNALAGTEVISDADGTDARQKDVGALCGVMGAGATLEAYYSGTNTDYSVTSVNGNAGGLIGKMDTGSSFTLHAEANLQGEGALVYAQNGYAGGIVGENLGGTVTVVLGTATRSAAPPAGGEGAGGKKGLSRGEASSLEGDEKKSVEDEKKDAEDGEESAEEGEKKSAEDGDTKTAEGDEKSAEGSDEASATQGNDTPEAGVENNAGEDTATAPTQGGEEATNVDGEEATNVGDAANNSNGEASVPAQGGEEAINGADGSDATAATQASEEATSGADGNDATAPTQGGEEAASGAGGSDATAAAQASEEAANIGDTASSDNSDASVPTQGGEEADNTVAGDNALASEEGNDDASGSDDAPVQNDATTEDNAADGDAASADLTTMTAAPTKKLAGESAPATRGVTPTTYPIKQFIVGSLGSGGLFGYYKPAAGSVTLDVSIFEIDCMISVKTSGNNTFTGGLVGVLEIDGSTLTIQGANDKTTVKSEHASVTDNMANTIGAKASNYGGLIGKYHANTTSDELVLQNLKVEEKNTLLSGIYAGAISTITGASYAKISGFELTNATNHGDATRFGGLVSETDKGYIYAENVTIGTSAHALSSFKGASLVGKLSNGVLGMNGTIDLTYSAPATGSDEHGQLVGIRDHTLIYSEAGWSYTPNAVEVDNVGSWGDVLTFGTALAKGDVFTEAAHIITIGSVTPSAIGDVASYAKASLLFQIDVTKNDFIADSPASLAATTDVTFTDDIDLTGTGLRGITRDHGSTNVEFQGSITGTAGKTIKFDTKNVGGSSTRPVYRHKYNGLVALLNPASGEAYTNLDFEGDIHVKAAAVLYVGALAAQAKGNLEITNCNTTSDMTIHVGGGQQALVGGLVGEAVAGIQNITVTSCTFEGTITGGNSSADTNLGGIIGRISTDSSSALEWRFDSVTLKGVVENTSTKKQVIGGMIAYTSGNHKATIVIDDVVADGLLVKGSSADSCGGLLGYSWYGTHVDLQSFSVDNAPTVKISGVGGAAGLVYVATGHWEVHDLDLDGIKMDVGSAKSVGMMVNQGTSGTNGIYLELVPEYDYKLSFAAGSNLGSGVFDEICAYSAANGNVMENGQGIISISTYDGSDTNSYKLKMGSTSNPDNTNTGLTYQARTTQGETWNPNSRYYYNLDKIDNDNTLSTDAEKLMRWGVRQYASSNVQSFFSNPFNGSSIPNGNYSMRGYSWYPVSVKSALTINGTFEFFNEEFTETESAKPASNGHTNQWSPLVKTQHYMMHNGLFYNVSANLTIRNITLKGTIGAVDNSGTGALVYGTVAGTSSDASKIANVNSTNGSISLAGVRVWNLSDHSSYAPLLINKTGSFVTLKISNVSTTSDYASGSSAATSLIGKAGASDDDTYVTVDFTKIKLDARTNAGSPALSNHGYNTTKSIFTNATLLERLVGPSGTYTYPYDDDWGGTTPAHNVTYGKEVGYDASATTTQYPGQEIWYASSSATDPKKATSYSQAPIGDTPTDSFTAFLPYVHTVSTASQIASGGVYYQLKVNHQLSDVLTGCGTYNDPYVITSAEDLVKISQWIASSTDIQSATINALFDADGFCADKAEHKTFTVVNGAFSDGAGTTKSYEEMRRYLAEAYYVISPANANEITLEATSGFLGLGIKDVGYHFRGVIVGNAGVTINNKTQYPLIRYSDGSVVKNLNVTVDANITLAAASDTYDYVSGKKYNANDIIEPGAYGAVIGVVAGGDNIIDNVQTEFGTSTIKATGKKAQYQPIGGFVGVVVNGGVIFKNMSANTTGLSNDNVITDPNDNTTNQCPTSRRTNMVDDDNIAWLYVNPIVGRVVNGFAINEATEYHAKNEACILNNGTKHYSITDIKEYTSLSVDEKLSVDNNKNITIPDAQSFFILSLIVNSGMGIQRNKANVTDMMNKTGYFDASKFQTVRRAEYSKVGTVTSDTDADFVLSQKDTYKATGTANAADNIMYYVPYVVANYTNTYTEQGVDYYFAKAIANSNNECTITLAEGKDYEMPDGFQGIGSKYYADSRIKVGKFTGNDAKIELNISYNYYFSYNSAAKADNFDNTYQHIDDVGLGLFNNASGTTNSSTKCYKGFVLTGSVKAECIDNKFHDGDHLPYVATMVNTTQTGDMTDKVKMVSVGALIGTSHSQQYIDGVALQNIDVKGIRYTGGMIGWIPGSSTTIMNTGSSPKPSYGIKVHGAGNTGGMIGRSYQGAITIDNNNATYSIVEVLSDCTNRTGNDYNYGVGGFIGNCRGDEKMQVKIENVIVGTLEQSKLTTVGCIGAEINSGGMIGISNKCQLTINNCKIYNQSVTSQYTAAGLVGYMATETQKTSSITNVIVTCKEGLTGQITSSNNFAGGMFGAINRDVKDVTVADCVVKGYSIVGSNYAGGLVGYLGHHPGDKQLIDQKLIPQNVSIVDCGIQTSASGGYTGGLVGYVNYANDSKHKDIYGYNVFVNDVSIDGTYQGGISGGVKDATYNVIKLVAFSRHNDTRPMIQDVVGNNGNYGTGGYVIFADYTGDVTNETWTRTSDVSITTNLSRVDAAYPYVNVNPKTEIDLSSTPKFLTSDGANQTAVEDIFSDINDHVDGYYKTVEGLATLEDKVSSFALEMGTKPFATGKDFPVLVIDDANRTNTTQRINDYIALLTNSTPYDKTNNIGFNYAAVNNSNYTPIFRTVLHKCTFDENGRILTIDAGNAGINTNVNASPSGSYPCLKRAATQFYMNANDTDTSAEVAQFTLLDVQYLDPSGSGKIVYHLYVPVYVRKLLEYDFYIHVESGTTYKVNELDNNSQNVLVENLGTPVTLEFVYSYNRTKNEWLSAINGGDSLLTNYAKTLHLENNTSVDSGATRPNFPSDTRMVLIDTQNASKPYYLNSIPASFDTTDEKVKELKLSEFSGFAPVPFIDMMTVTVAEDNTNGTLIVCDASDENATAKAVIGGEEKYLKYVSTEDSTSETRYKATDVTFANGGDKLTEHYFLSIYTPVSTEDKVFNYSIGAEQTLGNSPYPSRITTESKSHAAGLLMGYIYEQNVFLDKLSVNGDETDFCITTDDHAIDVEMRATIRLTTSGTKNVKNLLQSTNPPGIYQSLLIQLRKHSDTDVVGIQHLDSATVTLYTINGDNVNSLNSNWDNETCTIPTASYIELRNNVSLANKLANGNVEIKANVTLDFGDNPENIGKQFFPKEPDTNRTSVRVLSKIASNPALTAYSKMSIYTEAMTEQSLMYGDDKANKYYCDLSEKAKLSYDAIQVGDGESVQMQLGINANDVTVNPVPIKTMGIYNVKDFKSGWNDAEYLRCTIQLRSKAASNYQTPLAIATYLPKNDFKILDNVQPVYVKKGDNDTAWTFIYSKADLISNGYFDGNICEIPIEFKVNTGADLFENNNLTYSNYGVWLSVDLIGHVDDEANTNWTSNSLRITGSDPEPDYVKYTNTRIYMDKVNPNKTNP